MVATSPRRPMMDVYIHSWKDRKTAQIIEGHTQIVKRLDYSSDGHLLASKSGDGTVRLWDTRTWAELTHIPEAQAFSDRDWHPGTSFHPTESRLATLEDWDKAIRIWDIDQELLLSTAAISPKKHLAAKVVLLGKTDIGKSCLAMRLTKKRYITDTESGSTLGMQFWHVDAATFHTSAAPLDGEQRRITFWDFGGQDCYQLVHELFLDDTTMALVLIDPTRTEDAESQARKWSAILQKHLYKGAIKILVGAKQDQENSLINKQFIQKLCDQYGFQGYLEVSAKTGRGIDQLCQQIATMIPWHELSRTSRPELFQAIRNEIISCQQRGVVTLSLSTLSTSIRTSHSESYEEDSVNIVVNQLCQQGLISRATDIEGNEVVVLQVQIIERYAGSLIVAASRNPKGVPTLEERQLSPPEVLLPGIEDSKRVPPNQERVILECVAELMIKAKICFRHQRLLVFPTLFQSTDIEDEKLPQYPVPVYYDFMGAIDNIYASAVVKLILGGEFGTARLWSNRVEFDEPRQGVCGIRRVEHPSGLARLDLYFAVTTTDKRKQNFDRFIDGHLQEHGVDVQEYHEIKCHHCGETISVNVIQINIKRGEKDVICAYCRKKTLIIEGVTEQQLDAKGKQHLVALRGKIDDQTKKDAAGVKETLKKGFSRKRNIQRPVRLLHLSDLHFSEDSHANPQKRLRWLLEDLKNDYGEEFPVVDNLEYLVISGDFTEKGSEEGFAKAYKFIAELSDEMGLSAERVILVPGNHDAKDLKESYRWEPDAAKTSVLDKSEFVKKEDIYLVRDDDVYQKRFSMFDKILYHKYMVKPYPLSFKEQGIPYLFSEKNIQFLTFNSAWQIDQFHRYRSELKPDAVAFCLQEVRNQTQAANIDPVKLLRFAVFHHAITGPGMMSNVDVLSNLQAAGVRICLHGDVHELRTDIIGCLHPETQMFSIGTGSFGAPFSALPHATPRLYNLIEMEWDFKKVRVYVRKQAEENSAWEGVYEWPSSGGERGRVPYFDIDLS